MASTAHAWSTVQIGNYNLERKPEETYSPLVEMEGDYNPMIAYGQSKTANIWMANEIERRFGADGLHGLSIHPGGILTAGWDKVDARVAKRLASLMKLEVFQKGLKSVEQGAATQILAAVGKDYEGKGGFYMDDCGISQLIPDDVPATSTGYRPWAYDPQGEKRLWSDSLEMVGLKDDQQG